MDGATLFDGAQFAVDTTKVSPRQHAGGRKTTAVRLWRKHEGRMRGLIMSLRGTGVAPVWSFSQPKSEGSGQGSGETANFVSALSKAKAETAPVALRDQIRAAWSRWLNLLGCTARAFATWLEKRCFPIVSSAVPPEHEVLRESRF